MRQTISKPTHWLTFIIALAFGLRLYHLEILPAGLSLDEATNSLDALMPRLTHLNLREER